MGMKWRTIAAGALGTALIATGGCGRAPNREVEAGQYAFNTATESEAEAYAKPAFEVARSVHQALETELREQETRWFPSYDRARELAVSLKAASDKAEKAAGVRKEEMHDEITAIIGEAQMSLDQVRDMLANAPRRVRTAADMSTLKPEVANIESLLTKANDALQTERLVEARHHAEAASAAVLNMKAVLDAAVASIRRG